MGHSWCVGLVRSSVPLWRAASFPSAMRRRMVLSSHVQLFFLGVRVLLLLLFWYDLVEIGDGDG